MPVLQNIEVKSHSKKSQSIYLPGLNGIRAIASLAVLIHHIILELGEFGLNNKIFGTDPDGNVTGLNLAGYGVTMFFTLSGFLITYLLLKEKEVAKIRIKEFYIRRALRIWPLYFLYLGLCIATILFFKIYFYRYNVLYYVFLAANVPFILKQSLPFLFHYWSLGVEEQFYLFFPHIAKLKNKKLLIVSIQLIIILLCLKFIFLYLDKQYGFHIPYLAINITRFHIMLMGAVGGILFYNNNQRFILFSTNKVIQIISWLIIFLIAINQYHIASEISGEIVSIITVFLIVGQITKKNNVINLENRVCDFLGKISYGIYVIHPLLIFYFYKTIGHFNSPNIVNYLFVFLLIISSTIFIAYLSYEFYEKKFLKLKQKFSIIKSSSTPMDSSLNKHS